MPVTEAAAHLITEAATHLRHAAAAARHRGDDDAFSLWQAFAGQLDLAAGGLDPAVPAAVREAEGVVSEHIDSASAALHRIRPLEGPTDLAMWVWHLEELRRLATQLGAP